MADADCMTVSEMCPIKDGLIFFGLSSLYTEFPSFVLRGVDCANCIKNLVDNTQSCGIWYPLVLKTTQGRTWKQVK